MFVKQKVDIRCYTCMLLSLFPQLWFQIKITGSLCNGGNTYKTATVQGILVLILSVQAKPVIFEMEVYDYIFDIY